MKPINYLVGDATKPSCSGPKIIAHCCKNLSLWGAGFVLAISKRWALPEREYKNLKEYKLGSVQYVKVENDIRIANIIGQEGVSFKNGIPPIRYDAIKIGFEDIALFSAQTKSSIHMPRLGCGLAGGKWEIIENLITTIFCGNDIEVYVYDLMFNPK
jgi:O-acetyl-ADP-ribose deacetylase (regulator of RNase III)